MTGHMQDEVHFSNVVMEKCVTSFVSKYLNMYGLSVKSRGVGTAKRSEVPIAKLKRRKIYTGDLHREVTLEI